MYDLLGGKLRDSVEFASYLFFRYANEQTGRGRGAHADQLVAHARELNAQHGFASHKLKGGVFPPDYELECYQALAAAFPEDDLRYDPNAALDVKQAIRFGKAIEPLRNDYLRGPDLGAQRHSARCARRSTCRLATNTVVVSTSSSSRPTCCNRAVDVVLLDTTFWGGIRPCLQAATVCDAFQLGVGGALLGRARRSSSRRCCTSARSLPGSSSPPTRTTTTCATT